MINNGVDKINMNSICIVNKSITDMLNNFVIGTGCIVCAIYVDHTNIVLLYFLVAIAEWIQIKWNVITVKLVVNDVHDDC